MTRAATWTKTTNELLARLGLMLAVVFMVGCGTLKNVGAPVSAPDLRLDSVSVGLPSAKSLNRPGNESLLSAAPEMYPGAGTTTAAPAPAGLTDAALDAVGHESSGVESPVLDVAAAVAQGVLARAANHEDGIGQVHISVQFSVDSASLAQ